jgi:tetratricopeptide (TPR) repeat protein
MNNKFNQILISLLLVWVPLAFFVRAADGFTLAKELVGLLVVAYFALLAAMKGASVYRQPLIITSLLFTLWMVGDSYGVGLVKYEIISGSFHLWLILGTLIAVSFACARGVSYERLLNYGLIAGGVMSLYGLVQVLGLDALNWNTHFQTRAFATLGNPDYLGGYLVALLPLAFIFTLRTYGQMPLGRGKITSATPSQKAWFWMRALTLLIFVGLLVTKVVGSFIALAVTIVLMGVAFLFPVGRALFQKNKRYVLVSLAVLVVGAGAYLYRHGGLAAFSEKQTSVEQRVANYQVAWSMIKDNLWTGVGLGQIGIQYPKYQALTFTPAEYSDHPFTYSEHVHNDFLQFWVEGGFVGLVLFLALLLVYGLNVIQLFKDPNVRNENKELLLAVLASMTALLAQSMSNFPLQVAPTAILFGLFLAAPLALRAPNSSTSSFKLSMWQQAVLTLAVLAVLILSTLRIASSIAIRDTRGETAAGKGDLAVTYGNRLIGLSGQDAKAWSAQGSALALAGKTDEAYAAYQKSLELNPNYVESLAQMANLRVAQGKPGEALELCDKALAITPNYSGPIWTKGVCLFQLKRYEESAKIFETFLTYAPRDSQTYLNLGVCYIQLHRKADAVAAWKKAYEFDRSNTQALDYLKSQGVMLK